MFKPIKRTQSCPHHAYRYGIEFLVLRMANDIILHSYHYSPLDCAKSCPIIFCIFAHRNVEDIVQYDRNIITKNRKDTLQTSE